MKVAFSVVFLICRDLVLSKNLLRLPERRVIEAMTGPHPRELGPLIHLRRLAFCVTKKVILSNNARSAVGTRLGSFQDVFFVAVGSIGKGLVSGKM